MRITLHSNRYLLILFFLTIPHKTGRHIFDLSEIIPLHMIEFFCTELEIIRDLSKTMYQSVKDTWHIGPSECAGPCTCTQRDHAKPASFECALYDECEGVNRNECLSQYKTLQSCCSDLKVCGMLINIVKYSFLFNFNRFHVQNRYTI